MSYPKEYKEAQQLMLQEIIEEVEQTQDSTGISQLSFRVIQALQNVPRHLFVPPEEGLRGHRQLNSGKTNYVWFLKFLGTKDLMGRFGSVAFNFDIK